jgi:hypothetical protein
MPLQIYVISAGPQVEEEGRSPPLRNVDRRSCEKIPSIAEKAASFSWIHPLWNDRFFLQRRRISGGAKRI